jgi:hypothetical protein
VQLFLSWRILAFFATSRHGALLTSHRPHLHNFECSEYLPLAHILRRQVKRKFELIATGDFSCEQELNLLYSVLKAPMLPSDCPSSLLRLTVENFLFRLSQMVVPRASTQIDRFISTSNQVGSRLIKPLIKCQVFSPTYIHVTGYTSQISRT